MKRVLIATPCLDGRVDGGSKLSTVDRIDYSNDTVTATTKGPLSIARQDLMASTSAKI